MAARNQMATALTMLTKLAVGYLCDSFPNVCGHENPVQLYRNAFTISSPSNAVEQFSHVKLFDATKVHLKLSPFFPLVIASSMSKPESVLFQMRAVLSNKFSMHWFAVSFAFHYTQ